MAITLDEEDLEAIDSMGLEFTGDAYVGTTLQRHPEFRFWLYLDGMNAFRGLKSVEEPFDEYVKGKYPEEFI